MRLHYLIPLHTRNLKSLKVKSLDPKAARTRISLTSLEMETGGRLAFDMKRRLRITALNLASVRRARNR